MNIPQSKQSELVELINKMYLEESEVKGRESNEVILTWIKLFLPDSIDDSTVAWCAIFASSMIAKVCCMSPRYIAARKFMIFGCHLSSPSYGCLVVFSRGNPNGWRGHVGFYIRETETHILVLGGNQSDKIKYSWYRKDRLLGYRGFNHII